jgi:phage protein U
VVEDWGYGYFNDWVVINDYGYISTPTYHAAVYDGEGVIVTPEWWDYTSWYYGVVGQHQEWQTVWRVGLLGTHTENTMVEIPGQWITGDPVMVTDSVRINQTAARSDTSWAWQVPTAVAGQKRDLAILSGGGLTFPGQDGGSVSVAAMGLAGYTNNAAPRSDGNGTQATAYGLDGTDGLKVTHSEQYVSVAGTQVTETSSNQSLPHALVLTRTEAGTSNTTVVTQIAAKSAQFGGVVTVEGSANIKGVLRVMPAGDLEMGAYQNGLRPDGTQGGQ